jgi:hypothetical protein
MPPSEEDWPRLIRSYDPWLRNSLFNVKIGRRIALRSLHSVGWSVCFARLSKQSYLLAALPNGNRQYQRLKNGEILSTGRLVVRHGVAGEPEKANSRHRLNHSFNHM